MIKIKFKKIKNIFKNLLSEKTSIIIGNLSYLAILSLAPTIIITTSILNIISFYFPIQSITSFEKIYALSNELNLNQTTSFIINLICINFISSGLFSLLSTFENIYNFQFKNYLRKKLYSLALAIILLLTIIFVISITFFITQNTLLKKMDFLITLIAMFISILTFFKFATFQKLKNLYSGAVISALFLTIFTNFFFYIIKNFSNMKSYYGLLAPIIITILLIYYSCYIIYFGILLNIQFSKKRRIKLYNK